MAGTSQAHTAHALRGDLASRKFSAFYFKDGRLIGADSLNDPVHHMAARKLLAKATPLGPEQAGDPSVDLRALG